MINLNLSSVLDHPTPLSDQYQSMIQYYQSKQEMVDATHNVDRVFHVLDQLFAIRSTIRNYGCTESLVYLYGENDMELSVEGLGEKIKEGWSAAVQYIKDLIKKIVNFIRSIFSRRKIEDKKIEEAQQKISKDKTKIEIHLKEEQSKSPSLPPPSTKYFNEFFLRSVERELSKIKVSELITIYKEPTEHYADILPKNGNQGFEDAVELMKQTSDINDKVNNLEEECNRNKKARRSADFATECAKITKVCSSILDIVDKQMQDANKVIDCINKTSWYGGIDRACYESMLRSLSLIISHLGTITRSIEGVRTFAKNVVFEAAVVIDRPIEDDVLFNEK